jgi:serine/threonine-protein kinase
LFYEAKAASSLDHPNICSIYEIDETSEGQVFIAMAFYDGESLKDKIARGPLALEQVINYTSQIAAGLHQAHEKSIVHRDIKSAMSTVFSKCTKIGNEKCTTSDRFYG